MPFSVGTGLKCLQNHLFFLLQTTISCRKCYQELYIFGHFIHFVGDNDPILFLFLKKVDEPLNDPIPILDAEVYLS